MYHIHVYVRFLFFQNYSMDRFSRYDLVEFSFRSANYMWWSDSGGKLIRIILIANTCPGQSTTQRWNQECQLKDEGNANFLIFVINDLISWYYWNSTFSSINNNRTRFNIHHRNIAYNKVTSKTSQPTVPVTRSITNIRPDYSNWSCTENCGGCGIGCRTRTCLTTPFDCM